jgi:hypothetical protein
MGKGKKKKPNNKTHTNPHNQNTTHTSFWLLLHSSFSHTQQIFNLKTQLSSASAQSFPFSARKKKLIFIYFWIQV